MSETGSVKELMEKERQWQQKNQEEMIEMREYPHTSGSFTLPGEAGCEELTLKLAEKWGADVIRDSDGTKLSDEIINAGYGIYSAIIGFRERERSYLTCKIGIVMNAAAIISFFAVFIRGLN